MFVERTVTKDFLKRAKIYPVVALVGARQSGKTTLLKELMKGKDSTYTLFDDPDARELFDNDIKRFDRQHVEGKELAVLDEVQYCKDPGQKIKYLADTGRTLWLTASSETALGKEVLSFLVGRVGIMRLYPFSFHEFLEAVGDKELTLTAKRRRIWEHMTYGGYPKAVLSSDVETKRLYLADLFETMLLKDVVRQFSIEDSEALQRSAVYLASTTGSTVSYESMASSLAISFRTLKKYIDALLKAYLLFEVKPYFKNRIKEITKQPKLYFMDTGIRNAVLRAYPDEPDGQTFENYVACELLRAGHQLHYWRTKTDQEVDFVIEIGKETIPIEVKINHAPSDSLGGCLSFIKQYSPKRAFFVTFKGEAGTTQVNGCHVHYTDVPGLLEALKK